MGATSTYTNKKFVSQFSKEWVRGPTQGSQSGGQGPRKRFEKAAIGMERNGHTLELWRSSGQQDLVIRYGV